MNFSFTTNIEDRENKELAKRVTIIRALVVESVVKKKNSSPFKKQKGFEGNQGRAPFQLL